MCGSLHRSKPYVQLFLNFLDHKEIQINVLVIALERR